MRDVLPPELLQTFLSVLECGGVTRAAQALGRTQAAVSLQIRRLETAVGAPLLDRQSRPLAPTPAGARLVGPARDLLRMQAACLEATRGETLSGRLRVGLPDDFAVAYLPRILARFAAAYPNVTVETRADLSERLVARREAENLDLTLAIKPAQGGGRALRVWRDPMVWVGGPAAMRADEAPAPLAVHPPGCRYRAGAVAALERAGRGYRIVHEGSSLAGIQAVVENGLAVTVLSRATVPPPLAPLPESAGMPPLPAAAVALYQRSPAPEGANGRALRAFAGMVAATLDEVLR